jgi:hypothetical protein
MKHSRSKFKDKKLPKKIVPIDCSDKGFHERWTDKRNPLNIPHPFRAVLLGPPNSGKGCVAKNIIIRARPQFKKVIVVHCAPDFTTEWDGFDAEVIGEIPSPDEFGEMAEEKTLCILDDLEYGAFNKEQTRHLDRLLGFCSTHLNISVMILQQDAFQVPAIVRRCSNLFIFWKQTDCDAMSMVARKTGYKAPTFNTMFAQLIKNPHDSIWIDMTDHTKYPLRLNGFQIIEKIDSEDTIKDLKKLDQYINSGNN